MKTPTNPMKTQHCVFNKTNALPLAAGFVLAAFAASATDIHWQGATADYTNTADWVGGVLPGGGDNAINDNGSNNVVQINTGDPDWTVLDIRAGNGAGNGAFTQGGQTVTINGWFRLGVAAGNTGVYTLNGGTINYQGGNFNVGELGAGILNLNGGTITGSGHFAVALGASTSTDIVTQVSGTINTTGELWVGNGNGPTDSGIGLYYLNGGTNTFNNWVAIGRSGGNGTLIMTGGVFNKAGNGDFLVGTGFGTSGGGSSTGVLNQSGGFINSQSSVLVPESSPSSGTYNLSGTASLLVNNWIAVGRNGGTGVLNLSGGSITKTGNGGNHFDIGAGGPGTLNQTGGAITNTTSDFWLGENSSATWNFGGGAAVLANVIMCVNGSASATLNLTGGVFQATAINSSSVGFSTLNFDHGVLQANANNANFISGLTIAQISPGGATIDSHGFNITIPQPLLDNGGGSLTKNGAGTLVLTGGNSYSGTTTVNAGILEVGTSSSGGGAVSVANTAGFGSTVQSANGQLSVASLTIGGATGGSLNFDLGSFGNPSSAPLNVQNVYTANGTITVNVAASVIAVGTIPLLQYGSPAGTSSTVLGTLPPGVVAHLATAGNTLELVVTSAGAPRWDGQVTGQWDFGTNQDWFDLGTLLPTTYSDGKPVVFDDNAAGTTTVNLTAAVKPAAINFNNNSLPYTLVGNGSIGGATGINLNGAGSVAVLNTGGNNFTSPVVLNAGTLTVTNLANGGSPSPLGASSADPTNLVVNYATFTYSGAPVSINRGFTIGATNTTFDIEGNLALSGRVVASPNIAGGGSGFTKVGPAQLTLNGTNANEFANIKNPGVQVAYGTMVLDGSAGGQINHTANELWVGSVNGTGGSLILTNTTLNVDSWLGLGRSSSLNTTSTITLYNSAFSMGNCSLGYAAGIAGYQGAQILTLNGNSTLTNRGDSNLGESSGANVTVNLNGNSVFFSQNRGLLSMVGGAPAQLTLANSSKMIINSGWFSVADGGGSASLLLKNNASFSDAGDFNVTDNGAATATVVVQDNAQLTANNFYVGKDNNADAVFTITNNATVVSFNGLTMAQHWTGDPIIPTEAVVNLAGGSLAVNLVQGRNNIGTFNFNGGRLIARLPFAANFMFNLGAINVQAGGAIIDSDTNAISITEPLLDAGGGGGLTKLGLGALFLNGANTFTGPTLVSAGTLGGSGTLLGPVTVASGGHLAAASGAIGTLTINNSLTFQSGSGALLKLTSSSNDQITGLTSVAYAGSLVVSNFGASPLTVGTVYKLFNSAAAGTGNFTSVTLLPGGSATFNPATGELTITAVPVFSMNPPVVSGTNLVLSGSGGTPGGSYTLLTSTNVAAPLVAWTTNLTGVLNGSGGFSNAIPVSTSEHARFFRVRMP